MEREKIISPCLPHALTPAFHMPYPCLPHAFPLPSTCPYPALTLPSPCPYPACSSTCLLPCQCIAKVITLFTHGIHILPFMYSVLHILCSYVKLIIQYINHITYLLPMYCNARYMPDTCLMHACAARVRPCCPCLLP